MQPPRPLPKIFRLTKDGRLLEDIFQAATINTPSMLAVEDAVDSLRWAEKIGGLPALVARSEANLAAVTRWTETLDWIDFLAREPATRSCTSICLQIIDAWFTGQEPAERAAVAKKIGALLEAEGVAYDIGSYKDAPPGLRVWGGSTVEASDVEALLPWIDWAWQQVRKS
jgi:phosphoserine aminotransferase